MIQFKILSGKKAGTTWVARRFPVQIGRSAGAHLGLEEDGVWDQHATVRLVPGSGILLETSGEALATVNGDPVREVLLRNGDVVDLGSARLQFWLGETRQHTLGLAQSATWLLIGLVLLGQVALLYWLLTF